MVALVAAPYSSAMLPLLALIFAVGAQSAFGQRQKCDKDSLILLHVVSRHGDRTPGTYPTDIYASNDYYPLGPGRLTKRGIQRVYEVGRKVRRRYAQLLGSRYYYRRIDALSSSIPRCRMTAQAILAEMYPSPRKDASCREGQLVDFDYIEPRQDRMISTFLTCPQYLDVNFTALDRLCDDFERVRTVLRENSGFQITKPLEIFLVQDTLKAQEEIGLKLPSWVNPIWPEPLGRCSRDLYQAVVDDRKALRHVAGNLMRKIVEDSMKKVQGDSAYADKKVFFYSGHDLTVVGLLGILGLYNRQEISYGSHIMFEVHRLKDTVGFQVYHDNFAKEGPQLLNIPNCGTFCPLQTFVNLTSQHFPSVWCDY